MIAKFFLLLIFLISTSGQSQTVNENLSENEKIKSAADSLFLNKNYDNAIVMYSKFLAINDKDKTALFKRGISYFITHDNSKAIIDFSTLINLDDKNSKAYYFRALSKFNITSKSESYDAETNRSACDDLFIAKELGYQGEYSNFKILCPNL